MRKNKVGVYAQSFGALVCGVPLIHVVGDLS